MRAKPVKKTSEGDVECKPEEATHLWICFPGELFTHHRLGVIVAGSRDQATGKREEPVWTWNGDTDKVTLKPSVRSQVGSEVCHVWVTDGMVQFLGDSTTPEAGKTLHLEDVSDE